MNVGHEFVKVRATLVLDRTVVEEQIHQHGLAASDLAMDVETTQRDCVLVGEQALQQSAASGPVSGKPRLQRRESLDGLRLRRIGLNGAGGDQSLIMPSE